MLELVQLSGNMAGGSLAPPSDIAAAGFHALIDGSLLTATAETLTSVFSGLAIGAVLGTTFGLILGLSRLMLRTSELTIELLRPVPVVALIPVCMLIFGMGYAMEVSLVAFTAIWPVLLFTISSVQGIPRRLIEVTRLLGMGRINALRKVIVWAALPGIFVGFRLALSASLIIAVTIEIAANPLGIGRAMMQAQEAMRPGLMLAYLFWLGLIGTSLNYLTLAVQRRWFSSF